MMAKERRTKRTHMGVVVLWAGVAAAYLTAPPHAQAGVIPGALYGVQNNSITIQLLLINKMSAGVILIGGTAISVDGIAISSTGVLFAADNANRRLVTLDPSTGALASVVGSYGGLQKIEGLAFRPADGVLFGSDIVGKNLVTLDATGKVFTVGPFNSGPADAFFTGLAFVGPTLYAVNHVTGSLYSIDQTTGQATVIGGASVPRDGWPLGLAADPATGTLYIAEWRGGFPMTLATILAVDGSRSPVGTMGNFGTIEGLSFAPLAPECDDGIDNDLDGFTDFPDDPGCPNPSQDFEDPECDDFIDNDGDSLIDFPADPGCFSAAQNFEDPQCDALIDNDGDGLTDFGFVLGVNDPECFASWDDSEEACGLGFELAFLLPPLMCLRRLRRRRIH